MKILLTNDDSHDSPLFLMAIELLKQLGEITVVVPAEEQSWQGKSMTRFGTLYVDHIDIHGTPAFSVTGTPADCVNLALYNLMDGRPDVVVSGINIGINTGLGFVLVSGTLGACFEANIAGLPALALSQDMSREDYSRWNEERKFSDAAIAEMRDVSQQSMPMIWHDFVLKLGPHRTTWNINLPRHLTQSKIVRARLGKTFYGRCFSQRGDQYYHDLAEVAADTDSTTDEVVVRSGSVSATQIDISDIVQST
jgi:5'-nucleotidase|tara:strand:- start:4289 stop:5044 length:756 start_codon:yes stop_codon:yes gene_type:complete